MIKSLNSKVDITVKATHFKSFAKYGSMMVGNNAIEFYNTKNVLDYIQIPWEEIESVKVLSLFHGKWIPRFSVITKNNGEFIFATQKTKKLLYMMNQYIPNKFSCSVSLRLSIQNQFKNLFNHHNND